MEKIDINKETKESINTNVNVSTEELLNKNISPDDFLDRLMALDQSTPNHSHAIENIKILTNPSVVDIFETNDKYSHKYRNLLSISYFHKGQIEAMSNGYKDALESFELAREQAINIQEESYGFWKDYVEGTIAYLKKDTASLQEINERMEKSRNKEITSNFFQSLQNGEDIDYPRLYSVRNG